MFVSALKRQYWAYFLVVLSISLVSVFTRGFTEPLALGIAVELFMLFSTSFILFCIAFCATNLAKKVMGTLKNKSKVSKTLSTVLVLLLLISVVPLNADANPLAKRLAIFAAGTGFGAATADLWNAGKDAVTDAVKKVVEVVQEHYESSYHCFGCSHMVTGSHNCSDNYYYNGNSGY